MSRRFRNGTIVAAGAIVLTSCASNAPQDTWVPKGPNAKIIDDNYAQFRGDLLRFQFQINY